MSPDFWVYIVIGGIVCLVIGAVSAGIGCASFLNRVGQHWKARR